MGTEAHTTANAPVMLSRKEATSVLASLGYRLSVRALETMAHRKCGPPFVRFGWKTVAYDREQLLKWAESQRLEVPGDFTPRY